MKKLLNKLKQMFREDPIVTSVFIVWLLGLFFAIFISPTPREEAEEYLKSENLSGIVVKKFRNWKNHGNKTLVIERNGKSKRYTFTLDNSGFYGYVNTNDSLVNSAGSLKIKVYRNNKFSYDFILDFKERR